MNDRSEQTVREWLDEIPEHPKPKRIREAVNLSQLRGLVSRSLDGELPAPRRGTWRRVICRRVGHEYHGALDPVTWRFELVCLRCYGGGVLNQYPQVIDG